MVEKYPIIDDPGLYLIGIGDVIGYQEITNITDIQNGNLIGTLTVNEDGLINFFQLGRIKAEDKTLTELKDLVLKKSS